MTNDGPNKFYTFFLFFSSLWPSDSYENYPDKKSIYSEIILVAASGLPVNTRIPNDDRAWNYYLNDK